MTVIDVGDSAIDRAVSGDSCTNTWVNRNNPANDTGTITGAEVWLAVGGANANPLLIGVFYGSSLSWTYRAGCSLGAVTKGSKQTFSGLSFAVSANDISGCHATNSPWEDVEPECAATATEVLYKSGDHMVAEGAQTYTAGFSAMSLFLTGATPADVPIVMVISNRVPVFI